MRGMSVRTASRRWRAPCCAATEWCSSRCLRASRSPFRGAISCASSGALKHAGRSAGADSSRASPASSTRCRRRSRPFDGFGVPPADGAILTLSAADPLNLTGVVCLGERVSATASTRIAFRDGVPIATLTGSRKIDWIESQSPEGEWEGRNALLRRRIPALPVRDWAGWVSRGGRVVPFERSSDRFAMRFCVWRMPTSQSLERPGLSVESSRIPGWRYPLGSTGVAVMMSGQLATEFPNQTYP